MMRTLLISAALPAIMLAACATHTTGAAGEPGKPGISASSTPPHFPRDLSPAGVAAADDNLALEEVQGTEAMAFVARSNEKALAALTTDPRYDTFRQQAEAILTSTDRIPSPRFLGDRLSNFWQDGTNPKGLWRRTTVESYATPNPQWETLLDVDALARAEGRDWVFKGVNCLAPAETRCLISLSDGGKDAVAVREFDVTTKRFVDGGFSIPEGKHRISWLDQDTVLVATDFGPGSLTESGYPYIVKSLKRGQAMAQATEVYRGEQGDGGYGVSPIVMRKVDGSVEAVLFNRPLDTFRSQIWALGADGKPWQLQLPERVGIQGMLDGKLIFALDQDWTFDGRAYKGGDLLAVPLELLNIQRSRIAYPKQAALVFSPTARQSLQDVQVMKDGIMAVIADNVVGKLTRFTLNDSGWQQNAIAVPENVAVNLGSASRSTGRVFVSTQGFLTPPTLSLADFNTGAVAPMKAAAAKFDASTHVVEQFEATSTDGTKIPYFIVRPRDLKMDGKAPTILFGYGGFQASFPPAYKPEMGKLWLENGGVFVQANIRGGGEFGPGWHQAALRENRQRAFDDFAAVGRDLIARGITSSQHLGIYGRSNGGVLTSVSITQNPDLFNAAVIESPLIDMMRYQELPAGASWIGEYGDPRIPGDAEFISRYSAYQLLRPDIEYPRVYITTNTLDDRVHPGHARKFAARLGKMGHDHLYYEDTAGGHSNDADPVANARRWARHYVYLSQQLMDEK
ncbi:prolyl oligopeptidase family serine peptidase [Brevundimonas sp.]|uniref:prolyl oligopeptidase family serine peptidase n=2 Tax=unclassified Brevundimonas TaxID=2622653 RepID=UPI003916D2E9